MKKQHPQKLTKLLALVLAFTMAIAMAACGSSPASTTTPTTPDDPGSTFAPPTAPTTPAAPDAAPAPDDAPPAVSSYKTNTPRDTLVVAYGANMNGDFIWGFGNNAYDATIKTLLHGFCGTFLVDDTDMLMDNPTVLKSYTTSEDATGKTYTETIHSDLKWSDGTPITAKDYVGGLMFNSSPQWLEAGANSGDGYGLLGYNAYHEGETEYFAGVKLIDDYTFSITIDAAELPYFFEMAYAGVSPIPMSVYLPGVNIVSDANGSRFDKDILPDCQRVIETERFAPTVTCGPYMFVSFNNQICTLQRNPNFKGDHLGNKPSLEYIVQQAVPEATDIDMLLAGDIDLLPQMIEGEKIDMAKADPNMKTNSYLRNGYGALHIICDWGVTSDVNVRYAIAHLIDRNTILDNMLGGYGGVVDGEFGLAQWTYQERREELNSRLASFALNIDKANDYLDQSDYKFESDGSTPFDRSKAKADGSYMRYNSDGVMLAVRQAAASAAVGDLCDLEFQKNAPMAGMKYTVENVEFNILLQEYYYGYELSDSERNYSTFSMGLGFGQPDDKYYAYHSDWYHTDYNPQGVNDPVLDEIIMTMRRLDSSETDKYADLWVDYIVRVQEILPSLCLYSNEYFSLFNSVVTDVPETPFANWADLICEISKAQD